MKHILLAIAWLLWLLPAQAQPLLRPDATLALQMDDARFGGFSSLEIAADGMSFIATSDRGTLLRADILRTDGRLTGLANLRLSPIADSKGDPVDGLNSDAEGLALGPTGEIYMSFEGNHRVMVQPNANALPGFLPRDPDFRTMIPNAGLEALAVDEAGVVYAIPERSGGYTEPFVVYRLINGVWNKDWQIERRGDYLVTGADILDGQLYVLERDLASVFGFSSRIRRYDIGAELGNEQVLLTTDAGRYDNLEGISVWKTAGGQLRVLLISDDNFRFFQRNQLVEMVLEP